MAYQFKTRIYSESALAENAKVLFTSKQSPKIIWDCSWNNLNNLVDAKSRIMGLGAMNISTKSQNHKNEDFSYLLKVKVKKVRVEDVAE